MTNSLQVFDFEEQAVRVILREGDPWWVAKDVCGVLELNNITEALRNLDDDELTSEILKSGGQGREMRLISESGLYTLIIRSNKPEAKKFRKWVTSEVLPSIRKTGRYDFKKESVPRIGRGIMSAARMILKTANITGNQLTLALDKLYKHYTGESALAAMGVELEADDKCQLLTPTEIGREIGASGRVVNKLLEGLGYQKKINNKWEAMQDGADYSVMLDTNKRHSDGTPVRQLKWRTSVIDVLNNYLVGMNAD